jgi:hypothetical protein
VEAGRADPDRDRGEAGHGEEPRAPGVRSPRATRGEEAEDGEDEGEESAVAGTLVEVQVLRARQPVVHVHPRSAQIRKHEHRDAEQRLQRVEACARLRARCERVTAQQEVEERHPLHGGEREAERDGCGEAEQAAPHAGSARRREPRQGVRTPRRPGDPHQELRLGVAPQEESADGERRRDERPAPSGLDEPRRGPEQRGHPDQRRHHVVVEPDGHEAAQHEDDARGGGRQAATAERPREAERERAEQRQAQPRAEGPRGEEAEGEREHVHGVEERGLARGEEGRAREDPGIPERQVTRPELAEREGPVREVVVRDVGEQRILRDGAPGLRPLRQPREVVAEREVGGQEDLPREQRLPQEARSQGGEQGERAQGLARAAQEAREVIFHRFVSSSPSARGRRGGR